LFLLSSLPSLASRLPLCKCSQFPHKQLLLTGHSLPGYGQLYTGYQQPSFDRTFVSGPDSYLYPSKNLGNIQPYTNYNPALYSPYNKYTPYSSYPSQLSNPALYKSYDTLTSAYDDNETDASSDNMIENENELKNENQMATDNLAGAKSENANENANLAKGGEAFGFGALESDNRNLLANENNIEVANANRNELGVEVANFNANENSAEQESAALAEVVNEDNAEFCNTDIQENETENLNLNDNLNERLKGCRSGNGRN
jgi:hypothetical protein